MVYDAAVGGLTGVSQPRRGSPPGDASRCARRGRVRRPRPPVTATTTGGPGRRLSRAAPRSRWWCRDGLPWRGTLGVGACPDPADMVARSEAAYPSPSGPRGGRSGTPNVRGRRPEPRGGRASFLGGPRRWQQRARDCVQRLRLRLNHAFADDVGALTADPTNDVEMASPIRRGPTFPANQVHPVLGMICASGPGKTTDSWLSSVHLTVNGGSPFA